jgi:antitoxin ParD1/3/4
LEWEQGLTDGSVGVSKREATMHTVTVSLPASLKAFMEKQVSDGGYDNTSSFIRALLQDERKRQAEKKLLALVREADESGPATPMTAQDWENIRSRGPRPLAEANGHRAKNRKTTRRRA